MTLQLGETAPDFTVASTEGNIQFHEWLGDDWAVLFSHPADYTPVCTTELGAFAKRKDEFASRGVKLIGVSVDPLDSHKDWAKDIEKTQGKGLNFPLLADKDQVVADQYGMIHPKADPKVTVRTVFIIDSAKKIRLPFSRVGRARYGEWTQGWSRWMLQPSWLLTYSKRSCRRLGRPCQNSMRSGTTR